MAKNYPLFDEMDVGEEGEEDLLTEAGEPSEAVVTGTDWTTETVLSQLGKGNILLNPKFQRRNAWTVLRQSRFIESLVLGLPIPQIVLAENRAHRGKYIVIDGKQRLLTLLQFAPPAQMPITEPLVLRGLQIRRDLNNKTYHDLLTDSALNADLDTFQNQPIRTVVVKNVPNETFLFTVFYRLNSGSVPLSPQELRQALHPGAFVDFVNEFTSENLDLQKILNITGPDFRMRDTELLVRFFAFRRFLSTYDGNLKKMLDDTCKNLNRAWDADQANIKIEAESFTNAILGTVNIFGDDDSFSRWNGHRYERRFNRAVFDVMAYYFWHKPTLDSAVANAAEVKNAFEELCSTNNQFSNGLERTTKSIDATFNRLSIWGETLAHVLNLQIDIPTMNGGRINP